MRFYLASANLQEAEELLPLGFFDGIITNPTIVAQEKRDPREVFKELAPLAGRLYYQIADGSFEQMIKEGEMMTNVEPDKIRLKVPSTREGFAVMRYFSDQGLSPMATVVPTAPLMVLAFAAGAHAVSPYSRDVQKAAVSTKVEEIFKMQHIIDTQGIDGEICTGIYDVTDIGFYGAHGIASGFVFPKEARSFVQNAMVESSCRLYDKDIKVVHEFLAL
ncbi:MAG: transaldolase family protein [Sphaerochaetaceae bacterium]